MASSTNAPSSFPDKDNDLPADAPTTTMSGTPEVPQEPEKKVESFSAWSYRIKLAVALCIPVFLETLDYTVVASVQPRVASAFNSLNEQSWIGTSYILTSTVFLPVFGSLADIFGRYWALQLSLLIFLFGNALCTGARNLPMLLAGRGIAGVGCAGLIAVLRVILSDPSSLDNNNMQVAMMFILYSIGFATGPIIGGALATVSWRWIFAINLPCVVLSSALIFALIRKTLKPAQVNRRFIATLPNTEHPDATVTENFPVPASKETLSEKLLRVDWLGATLFVGGGILILLGLSWGSSFSWSLPKVIAVLVIGGVLIVAFLLWSWLLETYEKAASEPTSTKKVPKLFRTMEAMIPFDIYRSYDVCAANFASLTGGMVMFGCFYFVSIYFILVAGYSPTKSGVQLLYFAPGMGGGTFISLRLIKWLRQPKYPIIIGMVIQPIALGLLAVGIVNNNYGWIDGFLAMAGVGVGMTIGTLSVHARFSQPEERVAVVVSLNLFFRTAGGTIGLAQLGAVLNAKVRGSITNILLSGTLTPDQLQTLSTASINSIGSIATLPPDVADLVRGAFRNGTKWSFYSLVPWCALAAILCFPLSSIKDTDAIVGKKKENKDSEKDEDAIPNDSDETGRIEAAKPAEVKKPRFMEPISYIIYRVKKSRAEKRAREAMLAA